MKKVMIFMLMLLAVMMPTISADSLNYDVKEVYVNGILVTDDNKVQVETGTTAQIIVLLEGTGETVNNVRVSSWIGGYEYDPIKEITEIFTVENGILYRKTLYVEIPEDLKVDTNEYTIYVEAYDNLNVETKTFTLFFERERHNVLVKDVTLSPNIAAPGGFVALNVRLENLGKLLENDIAITASIEELGISDRVYIDKLEVGDQDDARSLILVIPDDAREKTYKVDIKVDYDNNHQTTSSFALLTVDGDYVKYDEEAVVSMSTIKDLQVGKESVFKVQITNFGSAGKEFNLAINGIEAEYQEKIYVAGGSTVELFYSLKPTNEGIHNVYITVFSDEGIVTEKQYSVDVAAKSNWQLTAVFGLFVLAILLSIIAALRRKQ